MQYMQYNSSATD